MGALHKRDLIMKDVVKKVNIHTVANHELVVTAKQYDLRREAVTFGGHINQMLM